MATSLMMFPTRDAIRRSGCQRKPPWSSPTGLPPSGPDWWLSQRSHESCWLVLSHGSLVVQFLSWNWGAALHAPPQPPKAPWAPLLHPYLHHKAPAGSIPIITGKSGTAGYLDRCSGLVSARDLTNNSSTDIGYGSWAPAQCLTGQTWLFLCHLEVAVHSMSVPDCPTATHRQSCSAEGAPCSLFAPHPHSLEDPPSRTSTLLLCTPSLFC